MLRRLVLAALCLGCAVNLSAAQYDGAHLRVTQLSYLPDNGAIVDMWIDDGAIFENVSFPFTTDYVEVASGDHTLTTAIAGYSDASASTAFAAESGHSYSVIVAGDYAEGVTFTIIDESGLPLDVTGSVGVVVNLTPEAIDISVNQEAVLEGVEAGAYGFMSLPVTKFNASANVAGEPENILYADTFVPLPNTTFLAVIQLTPNGDLQAIFHRSSALTAAEYLQSMRESADFARIADIIGTTDVLNSLGDDGIFTLFLPTDEFLESLPADSIPTSPDELRTLLTKHIVGANLPPYVLPSHQALMTLAGSTVALDFGATASGYWEIEGAPILWDVRVANGVIYAIDGIILP